jgi:hypothetical protein
MTMRERLLALGIVAAVAMWAGSQANATEGGKAGPLGTKVRRYEVQGVSIIEALRQLKLSVPEKTIILTVEVAPFDQEPEKNLTLALSDTTVKEVLDRIARLDPRYSYYVFRGELIHVFPIRAKDDPTDDFATLNWPLLIV